MSEVRKKSFVLYCDYTKHIKMLSDEDAGVLFKAILDYASDGTETELGDATKMAFSFIKAQMDRDHEEYIAKCEKMRKNGAKGGRPKKQDIELIKGFVEALKTVAGTEEEMEEEE